MSIRVNPNLKLFPHAIQDMHDFILLLNMYKHFKDNFSALWVYAMWMQRVHWVINHHTLKSYTHYK